MALAARHYQNRYGKLQDEIRWSERGLSAAQAAGNHQAIMAFYNNLGTSYHELGDLVTALQCFVQSLPADPDGVEDSDEWARISVTLGNIGAVLTDLGDHDGALGYIEDALAINRKLNSQGETARQLNNLGALHRMRSDLAQAVTCHEEALAIFRRLGDQRGEARALSHIAGVHLDQRELHQALAHYEAAWDIWRKLGDGGDEATVLLNVGVVHEHLEEWDACDRQIPSCAEDLPRHERSLWNCEFPAQSRHGL